MDFKRENGKYFIKGKEVTHDTYLSLMENELEKGLVLPDLNIKNDLCSDCQSVLDFIKDLNSMEPDEAVAVYNETIQDLSFRSFISGVIHGCEEVGNIAYKVAARNRVDLEDIEEGL